MIGLVTIGQFLVSVLGAGTIGGLASGELNRHLAKRDARKRHLGGLLCDLLELRHGVTGLREIGKTLTTLLPAQADQLTVALPVIMETVANPGKLHEHYTNAIVELAAIDPLLAFHLRAKNLAAGLTPLSKLALQDPSTIPYAAQAFKTFGEVGASALDEAILRVAKELGKRAHQETQKILERNGELPEEVKQIFALIPVAIQAAQNAQLQSVQAVNVQPSGNENSGAKATNA